MPARILDIPGVRNFRDMGGYINKDGRTLAPGRLFRSGHYAEIDAATAKLIADQGITTVVDFRSPHEKEHMAITWYAPWQPNYVDNPIGGNAAAWIREMFDRLQHTEFPETELRDQFILAFQTMPIANAPGLKRLFDVLIDDNDGGAALFHCTAGKDRTGIAGALIMLALEMPEEAIFEDFLLTNQAVDLEARAVEVAEQVSERAKRTVSPKAVHPLIGVEPAFLEAAFDVMSREHGSVDDYLTNAMGLTKNRRESLKSRLLA